LIIRVLNRVFYKKRLVNLNYFFSREKDVSPLDFNNLNHNTIMKTKKINFEKFLIARLDNQSKVIGGSDTDPSTKGGGQSDTKVILSTIPCILAGTNNPTTNGDG